MRVIDRNAEWMGVRILDLMENAGRAVAEAVLREFAAKGKKVLIVCGTGNNGGDGLTAARYLKPDCDVAVLLARPPSEISTSEALANYERVKDAVPVSVADADPGSLRDADVIVDALLGIGTHGAVREPYAQLIRAMNESGRPILSVDVPSGLGTDAAGAPTGAGGPPRLGRVGRVPRRAGRRAQRDADDRVPDHRLILHELQRPPPRRESTRSCRRRHRARPRIRHGRGRDRTLAMRVLRA